MDLDEVRARAKASAEAVVDDPSAKVRDRLTLDQVCSRWHNSAQDVPGLLELVQAQQYTIEYEREKAKAIKDAVSILVIAAMNFVQGDGDKDALEALVEAADMMPWTVLDDLGIPKDEE